MKEQPNVLMIVLVQQKRKFCLSFHWNGANSYLYVNKTKIYKFKARDSRSWYEFYLGGVSKDFAESEQSEMSLNGTVYDFLLDHSSIEKEGILSVHEYLMVKNNVI